MIADILKILRQQHNYTLQQVADGINVNASTYKNYEYGRREPDLETISKIADFYNVTTDFLLGRDPAQTNDLNSMVDSIFNKCGALPENMRTIVTEFLLKVVEESKKEQDKANKQRHVERLGDIEDTLNQEEQAKENGETSCA